MAIKGIPESGRSRVYAKFVDQVRTDAVLEAAGVKWIASLGDGKDAPSENIKNPTIRLFPVLDSQALLSADAEEGDLVIQVEMHVPSPKQDVRDWMDVWTAFEEALYPPDDREKQLDFERRLVNCDGGGPDAFTGRLRFVRPATVRRIESDNTFKFVCEGAISIAIVRQF